MKIIVEQYLDEKGLPEEFTWDLYPMVDSIETQHLADDGLPKSGTLIKKGMILVGKRGRGPAFDQGKLPSAMELHGFTREQLASKYRDYWTNNSFYATGDGRVVSAQFEKRANVICAIVEVDLGKES